MSRKLWLLLLSDFLIKNSEMGSDNLEQFNEAQVFECSFQRITEGIVQNGFADGVADGRETLYQQDFDRGYSEGFAMAFTLSQHKGFAVGLQKHPSEAAIEEALNSDLILKQDASRAHCQLCSDKTLEEQKPLDEIVEIQQKHNSAVGDKLRERYGISS